MVQLGREVAHSIGERIAVKIHIERIDAECREVRCARERGNDLCRQFIEAIHFATPVSRILKVPLKYRMNLHPHLITPLLCFEV